MSKFNEYEHEQHSKYDFTLPDYAVIGKLGEFEVTKEFLKNNIPVFLPHVDEGIDMVAQFDDNDYKTVQIKSSTRSNDSSVHFNLQKITSIVSGGKRHKHRSVYDRDEIQYLALYDAKDEKAFLIENKEEKTCTITKKDDKKTKSKYKYSNDDRIENVLKTINRGKHNKNSKVDQIVMIKGIDY